MFIGKYTFKKLLLLGILPFKKRDSRNSKRRVILLTRAPEVENSLLKCDLGGWDQDEEADPVKGAKVQVLCA